MWYHIKVGDCVIENAAWCYPEPIKGRENIKNHITFAKGVVIEAASKRAAR